MQEPAIADGQPTHTTPEPAGRHTYSRSARVHAYSLWMQRYIAFLRSINVGGRRVAGNELTEIAAGCGLSNAATFLKFYHREVAQSSTENFQNKVLS